MNQYPTYEQVMAAQKQAHRSAVRQKIEVNAGDNASIAGDAADVAHILIVHFAKLTVAIANAKTLEDVKKSAQPFANLASGFLDRVEKGEINMPFQVKGIETVLLDVSARADAVSKAITDVSEAFSDHEKALIE
jgi:hypothetical protein